jgi:hypothetical protein
MYDVSGLTVPATCTNTLSTAQVGIQGDPLLLQRENKKKVVISGEGGKIEYVI